MNTKQELIGVQYLRGIAALAVVVDHTSEMANFDKYFGHQILNGFLSNGARGVDLFFLISGFIVCLISFRGSELSPTMNGFVFAERRFTRIVPLMWVSIISYAALRLFGRGTFFAGSYLRALTLFPSGDVMPNQIWTLRHEEVFYVLFAFSFLLGRRKAWLLGLWFLSPFVYAALSLPEHPSDPLGQFLYIVANPVNVEFMAGFLVGVLWHKKTRLLSFSAPISPLLIFLFAMILFMGISYALALSFSSIVATTISALVCVPFLFAGVHVRCGDGNLDRFGKLMGDASYAIYLFHPHFVSFTLGVWSKLAHETPVGLVVSGTVLMATIAGVFVHLYVERPLLKASRNFMERHAPTRT